MQINPLADAELMDEYLEVYRYCEVEMSGEFESEQERVWKVY